MTDPALHQWLADNPDKLTPAIRAKIHVNFPADLSRTPTSNYIETVRDIRLWVEHTFPGTLGLEYDL